TIVMGEKNPKAENEWMILNQSLAKGQTFALYDASTGGTWAVALDEASVPGITKEENSYSVTADGCYSFYLKLIYGADQLYVGTGDCPEPPAEPTVTAINIAGSKVVGEELTFTATVAGFSAEPTIVYYVKLKSAEDYTTPLEANKFTSVKPGDFMVKAVATYTPEEGDAEEAFKEVEFTVTEEPQPTEGFGIKIDGETVVIGEKNPSPLDPSFEEWQVLNQALTAGQTVTLYNASTGDTWAVDLDPASVAGIEKGEGLYNITADGCYSFYIKLKFGEDQLYVGNGDCPVPPVEDTWVVAGEESLMGENWNPASSDNQMVKGDDGIYTLVKNDVALTEVKSYEYKFVANGSWQGKQVPADESNLSLAIEEAGTYTITFTLNAEKGEGSAKAEKSVITETPTNKSKATVIRYRNLIGIVVPVDYKGVKLAEMSDGTTVKVQ
ncbi:MAG: hypothetical protein MJ003_06455, partial [Paludibacteraceae bacterium]|nr:hypothetical protein [Paludibacteraceae bacterium]